MLYCCLVAVPAFGAELLLGEPTVDGERVDVPIRLEAGPDEAVAALDLSFVFDPAVFSYEGVQGSGALSAAGKRVVGRASETGRVDLVVSGMNADTIASGPLAAIQLVQSADPPEGRTRFTVGGATLTTPDADVIPSEGAAEEVALAPLAERTGAGGGPITDDPIVDSDDATTPDSETPGAPDASPRGDPSSGQGGGLSPERVALLREALRQLEEMRANVAESTEGPAETPGDVSAEPGPAPGPSEVADEARDLTAARATRLSQSPGAVEVDLRAPEETPVGGPPADTPRPTSRLRVGLALLLSGAVALVALIALRKHLFR